MKSIKSQRGQALIVIALAAVVLFGFAALAIDSSRVYSDKRHAQNAADTSALAAALAKIRKQDYAAAALSRAANNGYANDADSTVTVNLCSDTGVTCQALPAGADPQEYIRVRITSVVPMTLARVIGWTSMTNDVDAIARAKGNPNTPNPMFGAGLVAVRNDTSDDCFKVNGGADLFLHDTGIFVNCTGNRALLLNGSANIGMDANAQVAGCANDVNF
ncbi:MAG TPA: pilus assembly protein TadG-related protein, partial [Anaerolineales bacterium]|nr:pilus assembly protein TadG-related protein [Anaerolineales bacterium]